MKQVVFSPLQKIREERGLTKKELARLLKKRTAVISKIEFGKMRIPDSIYSRLMWLGIDPFDLAVKQEVFLNWRSNFYRPGRFRMTP